VKVIVMAPPGAQLLQPWRSRELFAQNFFDKRIHKNSRYHIESDGQPQHPRLPRRPLLRI
jgi:hypothetical protein